jgi:hypothetical protein
MRLRDRQIADDEVLLLRNLAMRRTMPEMPKTLVTDGKTGDGSDSLSVAIEMDLE